MAVATRPRVKTLAVQSPTNHTYCQRRSLFISDIPLMDPLWLASDCRESGSVLEPIPEEADARI
jgi:hypothetical protein